MLFSKSFVPGAVTLCLAFGPFFPMPAYSDAGHGSSFGRPGDPANVSRTIEIVASDVEFSHDAIEVKGGETIEFVVMNEGELLHEFNVGTKAMHRDHQDQMMEMMQDGAFDGVSVNRPMKHEHPNSLLLEPGETKRLVWTFPEDADLEYACNVPGHYQAGMKGEFEPAGSSSSS